MSRQQRRAAERQARKMGINPAQLGVNPQAGAPLQTIVDDMRNIQKQLVKMIEFNKTMFRSIQIFRETLERKGFLTVDDIKETENLYKQNMDMRDEKIKELLSSSMSDEEKIEFCLKDAEGYKPGYERLNLSPVRDLNVAPNTVNDYLIGVKNFYGQQYRQFAMYLGVPEQMLVMPLPEAPKEQPEVSPEVSKGVNAHESIQGA